MNKIISVNYGIASQYSIGDDSVIEMNYKLTDSLRQKVKLHEMRHGIGRYNKKDFLNDFHSQNSYFFESLKFAFINPESLINFFPLLFSYNFKSWTWNSSAFFPFLYFGFIFSAIVSGTIWGIFKTNFLFTLLISLVGYVFFVALMNGLLLLYTHIHVKREKWFIYKEVLD